MIDFYYITASYPYGPGESFIQPEIEEWLRRGRVVHILPAYPRGNMRNRFPGVCVSENQSLFRPSYLFSGFFWFLTQPLCVMSIIGDLMRSPKKLPKNILILFKAFSVAKHVKLKPALHLHAHWGGVSSTMTMIISRLTGIPWSLTCHRWDIYDNNLLSLKAKDAQFMRFISHRGMHDAFKFGVAKEKSLVIHMGVPLGNVPSCKMKPSKSLSIFCAANLLEVKGHCYLIDAIGILRNRGLRPTLFLFGDGPLREKLAHQCQDIGVDDSVIFLGHRSQDELLSAYKRGEADLFVLPSIHISDGEHEGVPVSLIEAMSYGIPVVSTKTGSIEELLPDYLDVTVPDKDPVALADSIHRLLTDNERYAQISEAVIAIIVKNWSVEICINVLQDHIFPLNDAP